MKLISMLFSGLLLAFASAASAQNYYVCDNGDDNNDGRSEATPFQTYEKAMDTFNKMFAGESVLFCRGGVFPAEKFNRLANWKCGPEKPCTIADYGDKSKPAPTIIADGITALNFQNGGTSRPDGGYHIRNLTLLSKHHAHVGIMLFNDVNDVVMDNLHIEGFNVAVYSAGANAPEAGSNQANDRITLKNSTIVNNKSQGWLGGCNDCVIENNHFENNGFGQIIRDHNVYIDSPVKSQDFYNRNIRFVNNTLLNSTRVDGRCQGASLVVHGIIKDLVIDNNVVREEVGKVGNHCWGIAVDPGNQLDESFVGLTITNNKLFNVGNLGIGCASCKNVVIADNLIVDEGNVLRYAIAVPNKIENSLKSENVTIRNNKIVSNHDLAIGISLGGNNPFVAVNNEISLSTTDPRSRCIETKDANIDTDVSRNTCKTHSSVTIIDEPASPAASEEETKLVEETNTDQQGTYQRSQDLTLTNSTVEKESDTNITISGSGRLGDTSSTTSSDSTGTTSGGSTSTSSSDSTQVTESVSNVSTTETETLPSSDSTQETTSDVSSTETTVQTTTTSTYQRPANLNRPVTVKEVENVTENEVTGVDENQCRVFARGRCMM